MRRFRRLCPVNVLFAGVSRSGLGDLARSNRLVFQIITGMPGEGNETRRAMCLIFPGFFRRLCSQMCAHPVCASRASNGSTAASLAQHPRRLRAVDGYLQAVQPVSEVSRR